MTLLLGGGIPVEPDEAAGLTRQHVVRREARQEVTYSLSAGSDRQVTEVAGGMEYSVGLRTSH